MRKIMLMLAVLVSGVAVSHAEITDIIDRGLAPCSWAGIKDQATCHYWEVYGSFCPSDLEYELQQNPYFVCDYLNVGGSEYAMPYQSDHQVNIAIPVGQTGELYDDVFDCRQIPGQPCVNSINPGPIPLQG